MMRAVLISGVMMAATAWISAWAHHLTSIQRNGGLLEYSAAIIAYALLVAATIALWTSVIFRIITTIQLTATLLRQETTLATSVATLIFVISGGFMVCWLEMARYASWFLQGSVVDRR